MPVGRCGCDWYASQEFNSSCVRAVRRAVRLPASLWLRIRATFLENASAFCRVTVAAASSETVPMLSGGSRQSSVSGYAWNLERTSLAV